MDIARSAWCILMAICRNTIEGVGITVSLSGIYLSMLLFHLCLHAYI